MIPRTGIEQPFLIEPPQHIKATAEFERTNELSAMLKANIVDDYRIRESGRIVNLAKTVFDVDKESPHYKNQSDYINAKELVKLQKGPMIPGRVEHGRTGGKNRYFKSLNPWYKPYAYQRGDVKNDAASKVSAS